MVLLVAGALTLPGTSTTSDSRVCENAVLMDAEPTSAWGAMGAAQPQPESAANEATRAGVTELRRRAGLTWDQVGRLFGVSRRSAHFWASGHPMSSEHEEHLHRLLDLLRGMNTSSDAVRAGLLSVFDGAQVLSLLADRRYADAASALGAATGRGSTLMPAARTALSARASEERRPLPPGLLAAEDAPPEPPAAGRGRAVRTRRSKDRGDS